MTTLTQENPPSTRPERVAMQPSSGVRQFGLMAYLFIFLDLVFIACIGLFLFLKFQEQRDLAQNGVVVQARILDMTANGNQEDSSYFVSYEYQPAEVNQPIQKTDSVERDTYMALEPNGTVTILYSASNPGLSYIQSEYQGVTDRFPLMMGITVVIVLLCVASSLGIPLYLSRRSSDSRELDVKGKYIEGQVIDRWVEPSARKKGQEAYFVAYAFKLDQGAFGEKVYALRQRVLPAQYHNLTVGATVNVHYLESDPYVSRMA